MLEVSVTRLDPEVPLPSYAHPGDAGCDLVTTDRRGGRAGGAVVLPTGISLALPEGYAAFVHPRSGLAAHHGVGIVNSPGTIDAGDRGEVKVILVNHDLREPVRLRRLDRWPSSSSNGSSRSPGVRPAPCPTRPAATAGMALRAATRPRRQKVDEKCSDARSPRPRTSRTTR